MSLKTFFLLEWFTFPPFYGESNYCYASLKIYSITIASLKSDSANKLANVMISEGLTTLGSTYS